MINIGILGCGRIAQGRHIPEYAENTNCRLAAFYNPTRSKSEELAWKYGAKVYDTPEALLADPEIDAVSVCSANCSHAELSIKALEAGKHVLCEKPMATTIDECEKMVKAAEDSGKILMIAHNQRFSPAHVKAKELIEHGTIGEILTFRTTFGHAGPEKSRGQNIWFFDKDKAAFGAMADLGIHKTDLIHYLTGQKITSATAMISTLHKKDSAGNPIGVDDNALCIYRLSGGAMGTMTASWTFYSGEDNSTVLYGTNGMMRIYDDPCHSIVVSYPDGYEQYYDMGDIRVANTGIVNAFVSSILNGTDSEISGKEALCSMRAVLAAIKSAETGKTVEV